jgi:L-threonylcarbamoyladenylate synthase
MPTETVYGIAADALNPDAVRATFALKNRPPENPLIVHVSSFSQADRVCREIPAQAARLAAQFWPGPLTLVLPKAPCVPNVVTAGLDSVAVRCPAHPVALELLQAFGGPLSAPSANAFTRLSPTLAEDIAPEIRAGLGMVLDGGPCSVGIESTVLDLSGLEPTILRPGNVSRAQLEEALGRALGQGIERKAPGMYPKHYAPRTPLHLVDQLQPDQAGLTLGSTGPNRIVMPLESNKYAAQLYHALAELDKRSLPAIYVELPPETTDWEGVHDRLRKAAHRST